MTVISVDGSRVNDRVTGGTSQNFSAETVQEFQISTFGLISQRDRLGWCGQRRHGQAVIISMAAACSSSYHNMAAFSGFRCPMIRRRSIHCS
jgi:hypothetical protein